MTISKEEILSRVPSETSEKIRAHRHYPALDGLRGIAVIMVVFHHVVRSYSGGGRLQSLLIQASTFMWSGVDLFFVLSGFLITGILLESKSSKTYYRAFYGRRVLRIFPLYYAVLLLILVLLPLAGMELLGSGNNHAAGLWTYTANFNIAKHGWPSAAISHLWSLSIEEQFYLIWPCIIYFLPNTALRTLLPLGVLAVVLQRYIIADYGYSPVRIFVSSPTHADGLLIGAWIALIAISKPEWVKSLRATGLQTGICLTGIAIFFAAGSIRLPHQPMPYSFIYPDWSVWETSLLLLVIALIYGWVILQCIVASELGHIVSKRPLKWLGKYSYGIYLLHKPLIVVVAGLPLTSWVHLTIFDRPIFYNVAFITMMFAVSIAAAWVSWNAFEKHFLKLKKYFPYQFHQHAPLL